MKKLTVGLGEVLWDDFGDYRTLGGAVTNFAVHSAGLGQESWIVSAIGHDGPGAEAARELQSRGVMTHLSRVDFPTGKVAVTCDSEGHNSYDIAYPSAWDFIPYTDELSTLARKADAVCFGTLSQRNNTSRETIHRFIEESAAELKVFDANLRQKFWSEAVIRYSMSLCNVLKISDEEYPAFRDIFGLAENPKIGCRQLMKGFSLKIVIYTCGSEGSSVFSEFGESNLPASPVEQFIGDKSNVGVVDTVGAGDAFTAGFVSSILAGRNVCEAHSFASRLAAFVCSRQGATPPLDELLR